MQTSFDQSTWQDDPQEERNIAFINTLTPPEKIRELFPYMGVALKELPFYQIKAGTLFPFVRVRRAVHQYPVNVVVGVQGCLDLSKDGPKTLHFSSDEVQVYQL